MSNRKNYDYQEKTAWLDNMENNRRSQLELNNKHRYDRKINLNQARHSVLSVNINYGRITKEDRNYHENHLAKTREIT